MPSVCADEARPPPGIWLLVQISTLPSLKCAVQFCGSSGACEMNGYEYAASTTFAAPLKRGVDVAVLADGSLRRLLAQLRRRSARKRRCSTCARGPSSQFTFSFLRADCACHQVSATNRDAALETGIAGQTPASVTSGRSTTNASLDARQLLDLVEIGAHHLAAEHAALLEDGVQHARHGDVDAEDRLAGDDVCARPRRVCEWPMIL